MGKKVKFTGSRLLGAELRRLRGDRSLGEVATLSRSAPLADRLSPLSAPTVSQVETGVSFPGVETLHSLAILYQTSVQRLLDFVIQERVAGTGDLPDDHDAVRGLFREAFEAGRWRRALALAARGEELARTASERIGWRANRAICLQHFGLREHGLHVLLGCTAEPEAVGDRGYQVYRSLAEALASAGYVGPAAAIAGRALELAPDDLPPHWRWQLLSTRARLLLLESEARDVPDRAAAQEALDLLVPALETVPADQPQAALLLRVQAAVARRLLGDADAAVDELDAVRLDASGQGQPMVEAIAGLALGRTLRLAGNLVAAEAALQAAERVAVEEGFVDEAFEAYYELHLLARAAGTGREAYFLRRCRRFHPLVQAKTPCVLAYERAVRGQA